jgi:hypothetical protein
LRQELLEHAPVVEYGMPDMRKYERLLEEGRNSRRTIADALEVLRSVAAFNEHDRAEICIGLLRLPSGDVVGLVDVCFNAPLREKACRVSLPTSGAFRAICEGSARRDDFEIARLDGAVVGADATVLLSDGTRLRAVEVLPAPLPYEPTGLDRRIVHHAISSAGAEQRCYRSLREGLPPAQQDMVPDLRFLDCSRVSGLDLPPLKVIAIDVQAADWTLRKLSQQKVADALRQFGMRRPKPRPRVK